MYSLKVEGQLFNFLAECQEESEARTFIYMRLTTRFPQDTHTYPLNNIHVQLVCGGLLITESEKIISSEWNELSLTHVYLLIIDGILRDNISKLDLSGDCFLCEA